MEELRFSCDVMLGRLARWLRFAGLDTRCDPQLSDPLLAALSRAEGRWLLTRDRGLAAAAGPRVVLVRGNRVAEQVAEIRLRLPLVIDPRLFFSRCSCCNGLLEEATRDRVVERIPPFVAAHADRFRACPDCGRVYWPGTHVERIARQLYALFSEPIQRP